MATFEQCSDELVRLAPTWADYLPRSCHSDLSSAIYLASANKFVFQLQIDNELGF